MVIEVPELLNDTLLSTTALLGYRLLSKVIRIAALALRDAAAAKRLFCKALSQESHPQPRVINTDEAAIYKSAIPDLKEEGIVRRRCRHRPDAVSEQHIGNILLCK